LSYGPSPTHPPAPCPLLSPLRGESRGVRELVASEAARYQPSFASPLRWGKKSFAPTGWGCFAIDDTVEQLPFSIFRAHVV